MITFSDGTSVQKYEIKVYNQELAQKIIDEILSKEKEEKNTSYGKIYTNWSNFWMVSSSTRLFGKGIILTDMEP